MPEPVVRISLSEQALAFTDAAGATLCFPVSTSKYGAGEVEGSRRTPRGRHVVRARIGAGCPPGTVFVGRRPTGEIHSEALARSHPGRDWILTRILWLSGQERGFNRLGNVDTMRRYIYIHAGLRTLRHARIDRLHPHAQRRHRRAFRPRRGRHDGRHRMR